MIYGDERLPERFWEKVYPEPNTGCWLWGGGDNGSGYGRFGLDGKTVYPHRLTALLEYGESDLIVDHLCRQHECCNPDHLEFVTYSVNSLRGITTGKPHANAMKTHCKRGHEFTPENTRWEREGRRHCRTCGQAANLARDPRPVYQKEYNREYRKNNREKLLAYDRQKYAYKTYKDNIQEDS